MSARGPDHSTGDLPEHEQKAWDAIVADLSGQLDLGPQFPKERSLPPLSADGDHPDPLEEPVELEEDEEGYVPPPPPPIPRPSDRSARFAWAAVIGGPLIAIVTSMLGWESWWTGLGVAATIGGFATLVSRLKERDDDGGNGAVV